MTNRSTAIRSSIPALSFVCLAFAVLAASTGCQGPPEDDTTDSQSTEESLIRLPGGPSCGKNVCPLGWVCCNASCGICTPPRGACIQKYCGPTPGDVGVSAGKCETDADCEAVTSCKGCECLARAATDEKRVCSQPDACYVNPCLGKRAYCDQGTCRVGGFPGPVTR